MAFVIEDDDQDGFGRVGGGGGGGGDYDIDLGDIPAPRARAAASGNRAKASGRGGAGAAASSSTAADATGGVAASAPASVTDKARYYLAKIKADKASSKAAAPPTAPSIAAPPSAPMSTTPSRTSELGLRGFGSAGPPAAAAAPAADMVTRRGVSPAAPAAAPPAPVADRPSRHFTAATSLGDTEVPPQSRLAAAPAAPATPALAAAGFAPGQRVASRYGGGDEFYPGTIVALNSDGTYVVRYDDGDVEDSVPPERVAPEGSVHVEALDSTDAAPSLPVPPQPLPVAVHAVEAYAGTLEASGGQSYREDSAFIPEEEEEVAEQGVAEEVGEEEDGADGARKPAPLQQQLQQQQQQQRAPVASVAAAVAPEAGFAGHRVFLPSAATAAKTALPVSPEASSVHTTPAPTTPRSRGDARPGSAGGARALHVPQLQHQHLLQRSATARSVEASYAAEEFEDGGSEYSAVFERPSPRAPEPPPERTSHAPVARSAPVDVEKAGRAAAATDERQLPLDPSRTRSGGGGGGGGGAMTTGAAAVAAYRGTWAGTAAASYARGGRVLCDAGAQTDIVALVQPPQPGAFGGGGDGAPAPPPPVTHPYAPWGAGPSGGYGNWFPPSPPPPQAYGYPPPFAAAPQAFGFGYGYNGAPPWYASPYPFAPPGPVSSAIPSTSVPSVIGGGAAAASPPAPPVPIPAHLSQHPAVLRALAGYNAIAAASDAEFKQQIAVLRAQLGRARPPALPGGGAGGGGTPGSGSDHTHEQPTSARQSVVGAPAPPPYTESLKETRAMFEQRRAAIQATGTRARDTAAAFR